MNRFWIRILSTLCVIVWGGLASVQAQQDSLVTPSTALSAYLNNGDLSYRWEVVSMKPALGVVRYDLLLTSQTWQQIPWKHQLTLWIPERLSHSQVLLMIAGGSLQRGEPRWSEGDNTQEALARLARQSEAPTAQIRQVPNQPLFDSLTEDALIAYTLLHLQQTGDMSWPLLFSMTKSVVRAMDAITEFSAEQLQRKVEGFVVSGLSKRGWTTWLTALSDERVIGAVPMVIDMLNMPHSIPYQVEVMGTYSDQIADYSTSGITEIFATKEGEAIVQMIDPYSYRRHATMPKLLVMGTNDPYWATDNVKNYLDSIPGITRLCYIPNAGHDLRGGEEAMQSLGGFFETLMAKAEIPACSWKTKVMGHRLKVEVSLTSDLLRAIEVWEATSLTRDFRKSTWKGQPLDLPQKHQSTYNVSFELPASGYAAQYVALTYASPDGSLYTFTTRIFVTDSKRLW